MNTRTIPEDQWIDFFDHFSQEHEGWLATIQVLDDRSGPHQVAQNLPLQGISFQTAGTPSVVDVSLGDEANHVNHVVDMPLFIRQVMEPNGSIDVQIEPARGPFTLIHLEGPRD